MARPVPSSDTVDVVKLFQLDYFLRHGRRISYDDALYLRSIGKGPGNV